MPRTDDPNPMAGGNGGTTLQDLDSGRRKRASLQLIERAVTHGWDVPEEWKATLPRVAAQIAASEESTDRDKLRALLVLQKMARDRIDAAVILDKLARLDLGESTENFGIREELKQKVEQDPQLQRQLALAARAAAKRKVEGNGSNGRNGNGRKRNGQQR